jgi:cytochrome c-type biogenesis protein CcmH
MKIVFFLFSLFSFLSVSLAQSDIQLENQARLIGNELRCPVCGGSAITESPSDFARSMLAEVKAQVKAGKSESEIKAYFSSKYGNTVLLKPPFSGITVLVWVLPILVLSIGAVVLVSYLRRSSQKPLEATDPVLLEKVRAQFEAQKVQL